MNFLITFPEGSSFMPPSHPLPYPHVSLKVLIWQYILLYFYSDLARRQTIEDLHSEKESEKRKIRKDESEDGDSVKWRSLESQNSSSFGPISSASPDRKSSVESRSKVFRHKLQRIYSLDIRDWSVDAPNVVDRNEVNDQVLDKLGKLANI